MSEQAYLDLLQELVDGKTVEDLDFYCAEDALKEAEQYIE